MQRTAQAEQDRLELIENAPDYIIAKRDDFAGMVKLLDIIQSDRSIQDLLRARRVSARALLATDTDVEVAD